MKKTFGMALASISAALLNYLLNAFFIPIYGYAAAAYTTLVGYLWLLAVHMVLVKRIGYSKVYNYRLVLTVSAVLLLITVAVNFLYGHTAIRYAVIILYVGTTIYLTVKYGKVMISIFKSMKSGKTDSSSEVLND